MALLSLAAGQSSMKRTRAQQVCACGVETLVLASVVRVGAGRDLVDGIDHGPGNNQPVHHL